MEEVQVRLLDPLYPIIYFDCSFVKPRQNGAIRNKAVYLAGHQREWGEKLLGMWLADTAAGELWLSVFNESKNRSMNDCFSACANGLRVFPASLPGMSSKSAIVATRNRLTPFFDHPSTIRKVTIRLMPSSR